MTQRSDQLVEMFKDMTLDEITEFRHQFEETFGVSAAEPVAVDITPPAPEPEEAPQFVDLILESAGEKKIQVIKLVRQLGLGLGLKEAKALVDSAPVPLLRTVTPEVAAKAWDDLVVIGATVRTVPATEVDS